MAIEKFLDKRACEYELSHNHGPHTYSDFFNGATSQKAVDIEIVNEAIDEALYEGKISCGDIEGLKKFITNKLKM